MNNLIATGKGKSAAKVYGEINSLANGLTLAEIIDPYLEITQNEIRSMELIGFSTSLSNDTLLSEKNVLNLCNFFSEPYNPRLLKMMLQIADVQIYSKQFTAVSSRLCK